jgi:uncharacterized protein YqgC (DUF456 family)
MATALLWVACYGLIALGVAGIVLPAVPGTALILVGIVLGAWADKFTRVGLGTLSVIGGLAVLAWVLDYVAGLMGARKAGASRQALVGAAVGTVAGIFMGLVGVFVLPLVGAALGEYVARRDHAQAMRVGVATWLGFLAGTLAKIVIAFVMVGLFLAALAR